MELVLSLNLELTWVSEIRGQEVRYGPEVAGIQEVRIGFIHYIALLNGAFSQDRPCVLAVGQGMKVR